MVFQIGPVIELQECLRDSPKFRSTLEEQEAQIELLEQKLEKVIKACGTMVDTGKTYVSQQSQLANSLWDLSVCFHGDPDTTSKLNRLIHALQEMNKFHTILLDQASRTILKNLTSFVKEDIKAARESRHYLEKVSSELDAALQRNSSAVRSRPLETEEANNLLAATRACFRHTALSHVHCVTMLQAHKQHELISTLLSYMHACTTYFHQGYDLCEGLQPFFKSVSDDLEIQRTEASKLEKTLNNCHTLVTSQDVVQPATPVPPSAGPPHMEGYLFKRTSNAFKTWNRRWFYLDNNQLVYRKRTGEDSVTVMEDDLRLCSVKPVVDSERRFCFEVLSPTKSHMLQADSEDMYQAWVNALNLAIGAALQHSHGHADNRQQTDRHQTDSQDKLRKSKIWEQLVKVAGNDKCCDCGDPDPKWASINLGVTLCIACSGVHRSLGVHYSKVRSLTLDAWEPEILKVMAELGNCVVNNIYEANIEPDIARATPSCVGGVREAYIKAKWVERKFVRPLAVSPARLSRSPALRKWSVRKLRRRPHSSDPSKRRTRLNCVDDKSEEAEQKNASESVSEEVILIGENLPGNEAQTSIELSSDEDSAGDEEEGEAVSMEDLSKLGADLLLYKASAAHNLPVMCLAMAEGADKGWRNSEDNGRTHLHQAVLSGSVMACEYLLLNGAKINSQDDNGQTPLHLATSRGHTAQVWLLLKHRADQHMTDSSGAEPLAIAIQEANADIVTLLRLGRLNEEMDLENGGTDDTFSEVVRDYSQMACTQPQRLVRDHSISE
uniref:Arf-GAP with coiled-coil, ANK repeat and PH domain-containing protein 2 n=1 Tax=Cuerna arida TaxID=1464854 RepID=A0A1B6G7X6_9HEMI